MIDRGESKRDAIFAWTSPLTLFAKSILLQHTLLLLCLWPLPYVWSNTALKTCSLGGAVRGAPSNMKNGDIFSYVLGTSYVKFEQFQTNGASGQTIKQNMTHLLQ